jgi:hypothetical protein
VAGLAPSHRSDWGDIPEYIGARTEKESGNSPVTEALANAAERLRLRVVILKPRPRSFAVVHRCWM